MNLAEGVDNGRTCWRQQVGDLQERSRRAYLSQDVDEFGRFLSDDFVVNSPIGRILTKGEVLELLGRGVIRHFSYEEQVELMTRRGETVLVMGRDVVTMTPGGQPVRRRFTNVWCLAADSWLLVARHAQPLAGS